MASSQCVQPTLLALALSGSSCLGSRCALSAASYARPPAIATVGRSSAVGLYVTFFYIGGSAGAVLPGLTLGFAGWPATVAICLFHRP